MQRTFLGARLTLPGLLIAFIAVAFPAVAEHLPSSGIRANTIRNTCVGGIVVKPTKLNFGTVKLKKKSSSMTVNIKDDDDCGESFELLFSITGADAGDFLETSGCPAVIHAANSCTVNVKFAPRKIGSRTASLEVRARARTGTNAFFVKLKGTGSD